jgi:hypothetical protein
MVSYIIKVYSKGDCFGETPRYSTQRDAIRCAFCNIIYPAELNVPIHKLDEAEQMAEEYFDSEYSECSTFSDFKDLITPYNGYNVVTSMDLLTFDFKELLCENSTKNS